MQAALCAKIFLNAQNAALTSEILPNLTLWLQPGLLINAVPVTESWASSVVRQQWGTALAEGEMKVPESSGFGWHCSS